MSVPERSVLGVPRYVRQVFRVFMLEKGCLVPVSPPFDSIREAVDYAIPLTLQHGDEALYSVRPCLTLLI